jgi:hypothetical protein
MEKTEAVCDIHDVLDTYNNIVETCDKLPECLIVNSKDETVLSSVLGDQYIKSSANDMYSNNILGYFRDIQVKSGILSSCKAKFMLN